MGFGIRDWGLVWGLGIRVQLVSSGSPANLPAYVRLVNSRVKEGLGAAHTTRPDRGFSIRGLEFRVLSLGRGVGFGF